MTEKIIKLVALNMITCSVSGNRTILQPGDEVPAGISNADLDYLKKAGSVGEAGQLPQAARKLATQEPGANSEALQKAQAENAELLQQLQGADANAKSLAQQLEKAQGDIATLVTDSSAYQVEIQGLRKQLETLTAEAAAAQSENEKLAKQLKAAQAENEKLKAKKG